MGGNLKLKLGLLLTFLTPTSSVYLPSPVGASLSHIGGAFIGHENPILFWISELIIKLSTLAMNIEVTLVRFVVFNPINYVSYLPAYLYVG